MIEADLAGAAAHGISRLAQYVHRLKLGAIKSQSGDRGRQGCGRHSDRRRRQRHGAPRRDARRRNGDRAGARPASLGWASMIAIMPVLPEPTPRVAAHHRALVHFRSSPPLVMTTSVCRATSGIAAARRRCETACRIRPSSSTSWSTNWMSWRGTSESRRFAPGRKPGARPVRLGAVGRMVVL